MRTRLAQHPRLVLPGRPDRLKEAKVLPHLQRAAEQLKKHADAYCTGTRFEYPKTRHNAHLIRARIMQTRVMTLLARWVQTGNPVYRRAVMAHARQMDRWKEWSWILWRVGNRDRAGIFDLSYGENSATLAFIWDCLRTTLTDAERAALRATVRRWSWAGFLAQQKVGRNGWFGRPESNWNAVCAGGLGLLALTTMEDEPEAAGILKQVEASIRPYMACLNSLDGGWPEGIGYWGYGMRYAFLYLLSWEHAMGREHRLMTLPGVRRTLDFPLEFSPHGIPCSFGDVNRYWLHPFHYALAERFGRDDVIGQIDALCKQATPIEENRDTWPSQVELLAFHPRRRGRSPKGQRRVVRRYRALDWYWMSDRWPDPRLYVSIRGGTTEVPHGHLDLTSFHCTVGSESILGNVGVVEYLDTTFGPRRWELYETSPASKNMLLINGVGISRPSSVKSRALRLKGYPAVRLDASDAMGCMRDGRVATFYGRCFILLDDRGLLVLDHVRLKHYGRIEARFHTEGTVRATADRARIVGRVERAVLTFAASEPCVLRTGKDPTTTPGTDSRMIRWGTKALHTRVTLATLVVPGGRAGQLGLRQEGNELVVRIVARGKTNRFVFNNRLYPVR